LLPVLCRRRRSKHAERGIRTAEQPDARHNERAYQQDAGARTKHSHQATSVSRRIGKDRAGLLRLGRIGAKRSVGVVRMDHEASLGESGWRECGKRGV
jgi:hypothetical protein